MKPTMKNLNEHLHRIAPYFDLHKGDGYFYFSATDDAPNDIYTEPESIYVYALNQMTYGKWCHDIDRHVGEWLNKN